MTTPPVCPNGCDDQPTKVTTSLTGRTNWYCCPRCDRRWSITVLRCVESTEPGADAA